MKTTSSTVLVTGSNRGIGLALTRHLLLRGHRVIAACRDVETAAELKELSAADGSMLEIQPLDITNAASVAAMAKQVGAKFGSLDVLVNNAGVLIDKNNNSIRDLDFDQLAATLETNLVGTARVTKALWPLLAGGNNPRVVNISAGSALIAPKRNTNYYAYSISKAAVNMLTRMLEIEGRQESICVVAATPGRVKTRMNDTGLLTADEVGASLAAMIEKLTVADTGAILDRNGKPCFKGTFTDGSGQVCHVGW